MKLLLALLVLSLSANAAAQAPVFRSKAMDPRIDINSLPRSGSSLHFVSRSGSYVATNDIQCGAGETAIEIGPAASSVVIDFNGFGITGTPGLSSVCGVKAGVTPIERVQIEMIGPRIFSFGGNGIEVQNVADVVISDAHIANNGGNGVELRAVVSARLVRSTIHHVTEAVSVGNVSRIFIQECDASHCVTGMHLQADDIVLCDSSISSCSVGCVLIDDSSPLPGASVRGQVLVIRVRATDSTGFGVKQAVSGGQGIQADYQHLTIADCTGDGFDLSLLSSSQISARHAVVWECSADSCGGTGFRISDSTSDRCDISLGRVRSSSNGGHGIEITGTPVVSMESVQCSSNALSGVQLTFAGAQPTPTTMIAFRIAGGQSTNNGLDGLTIDGSALVNKGLAEVRDFSCEGNHRDGWNVLQADCHVFTGLAINNAADGMHISGGDLDLTSVVVSDNGDDGVDMSTAHFRSFDGKVWHNAKKGLNAINSSVMCRNMEVSTNLEDGVYLQGSTFDAVEGSLSENGHNGLRASDSNITMKGSKINLNFQRGLDLDRSGTYMLQVVVTDNTGDGMRATGGTVAVPYTLTDCEIHGNQGLGLRLVDRAQPVLTRVQCSSNGLGGLSSSSSGACVPVECRISQCTFDSNGGTACFIGNAKGGVIEGCTMSSSNIGLYVSNVSGSCSSGLRVTDCTATQCGTGFQLDASGGHLVLRNFASQCTLAPFAVGTGNLCGPVIANSADMALSTNPGSNYAQ